MQTNFLQQAFKTLTMFNHQCNQNSILLLGDSIQILKEIESQSIDLIFADPPYGIGKDFGASKDTWENAQKYLEWCKIWIDECMRNELGEKYLEPIKQVKQMEMMME